MNKLYKHIRNFENYLHIEKNYSIKTVKTYKCGLYDFAEYLAKECNKVFLEQIDEEDLKSYIIHLKTVVKNKPRTINLRISTLKSFYRYLVEKKHIEQGNNCTYNLKLQKLSKSLPIYLNYEEAENLLLGTKLLSSNSCRDYALMCVFLMTGARLSEVANLSLLQVDFTNSFITYYGKGSKERTVPMITRVESALREYINFRNKSLDYLHNKDTYPIADKVFLNKYGKPLTARGIQYVVTNLLKTTGIYRKGLSVHKLRHTCFTLLHRSGVDILTIKRIAGHENIRTTEIYTHINDKELQLSMQRNPLGSNSYDEAFIQKIKDKYFGKKIIGKFKKKRRV